MPSRLSQLARNEYYADDEEMPMAFAEAVNAEALAVQAAGANVAQLHEPWLRSDLGRRPATPSRRSIAPLAASPPSAAHLCFGYAFVNAGEKPKAYPFLDQLVESSVEQVAIEAAQPGLDLDTLRGLSGKTIVLGVLNLASKRPRPQMRSPVGYAPRLPTLRMSD